MVRDYEPGDREAIEAIYREQGLDYLMPDLSSPLCFVKKVCVHDGRVVGACVLRLTAETILLVAGSPVTKMAAIDALQPEVLAEAYAKGLDEVFATVPDTILSRFQKRLRQLGWSKDRPGWTLFSRSTRNA